MGRFEDKVALLTGVASGVGRASALRFAAEGASVFGVDAAWVGTSAAKIWAGWVSPFLLGDVLKAAIAAMFVSGAWAALKSRNA